MFEFEDEEGLQVSCWDCPRYWFDGAEVDEAVVIGADDDGLTPQQRAVLMGFDTPPF